MKKLRIALIVVALIGVAGWTTYVFNAQAEAERYDEILKSLYEKREFGKAADEFFDLADQAISFRVRRQAREMAQSSLVNAIRDISLTADERVERYQAIRSNERYSLPEEFAREMEREFEMAQRRAVYREEFAAAQPAMREEFERITREFIEPEDWENAVNQLEEFARNPLLGEPVRSEVFTKLVEIFTMQLEEPGISRGRRNALEQKIQIYGGTIE